MSFFSFQKDTSPAENHIQIDFSQNIWWSSPPPELKDHLFRHWEKIQDSPAYEAERLRELIAEHYEISPSCILLLNGWEEGLNLVAQLFKQKESLIISPNPEHYQEACKFFKQQIRFSDAFLSSKVYRGSKLAILSNPNYIHGKIMYADEMEEIAAENLDTFFLVDETYIDFNQYVTSFNPLVSHHKNIAVLNPLSEKYQLLGLPIAFLVAHRKLIERLEAYKMAIRLNTFTLLAGKFLIQHNQSYTFAKSELFQIKEQFFKALNQLDFLEVVPSYTHYFLCRLKEQKAADLQQYLKNEHQIIIREVAHLSGLTENHFALITQKSAQNQQLIEALRDFQV